MALDITIRTFRDPMEFASTENLPMNFGPSQGSGVETPKHLQDV